MLSVLSAGRKNSKEAQEIFWRVWELFITLFVIMVSQVYEYVQTHQDIYIKYIQLFVY